MQPQDVPKSIRDMRAAHTEAFLEAEWIARRAQAAGQTLDRANAKAEAQPNEPTAAELARAARSGQLPVRNGERLTATLSTRDYQLDHILRDK